MLCIALGFALILGVAGAALVLLGFSLNVPIPIVNSIGQVSELAGLVAILYGLWMPHRTEGTWNRSTASQSETVESACEPLTGDTLRES